MWLCSTMSRKQNSNNGTKNLPVSNEMNEIASNLESLRELTQSASSIASELPNPEEILQTFQEGQRQGKCNLQDNIVYPPNCYGYYTFEEVVEQLCGYRKIYKHSQKKIN